MSRLTPCFLALYEGADPTLHRTPEAARAHCDDYAAAEARGRCWDWSRNEDGDYVQFWVRDLDDARLHSTSGHVSEIRPPVGSQERGKDTIAELASAVAAMGALPVPLGHTKAAGLSPERAAIAKRLGDAKPARDGVLVSLAQSVKDRAEHDHTSQREDWYCLNLASYMGERMGPVLRRLLNAESEGDALRARVAELEAALPEKDTRAADQATVGESTPAGLTVYRVDYDGHMPCGLYSNLEAARAHCQSVVSDEYPADAALFFEWSIDEDDAAVVELDVRIGTETRSTGYTVTTLTAEHAFDPDADW